MSKPTLATIWLDGCSGCHMSFLDIDQRILELADKATIVYSPIVDTKELPASVDIALVEGSVSTNEDLAKIKKIRQRAKILVALGDCAVTGNIPAMRNKYGPDAALQLAFKENVTLQPQIPDQNLPKLLDWVYPVDEIVKVDVYLQGCPPPADAIWYVLTELLEGRTPDPTELTRFGK